MSMKARLGLRDSVMGHFDADNVASGPLCRARIRVTCLLLCTGSIGLWLELGCRCDVRLRARLSHSLVIMRGQCQKRCLGVSSRSRARVRVR